MTAQPSAGAATSKQARLAPSLVILSKAKDLNYRLFVTLRMTSMIRLYLVKYTNVMRSDLAQPF